MNANEMRLAIQNRLREIGDCEEGSFAATSWQDGRWIRPVAIAAAGAVCLVAAAAIPLTAIHTFPILASAVGGTGLGWVLTASTLTKAGVAICGTAFSVPLAVPVTLAATLGGATSGGGLWLWEMAHRTASVWAVASHWTGIGLIAAGIVWAGYYLALRYWPN
jgi:hypothetical protein